ncbi:hypothetical protein Tco_1124200 [Tanacetum coccineum]|uniref:Uncharacterized protein n=1 Tax=Tanacetum coccineum TaxID=301880 RepID=A0ABQ5J5L7_9ASTR
MNINSRLGATIYEFMSYLSASITARITEQVKSQLPQILPNKVYNFAHPVIKSMVTESLERAVLAKESSQPKSTYEAASSLTEFELKRILIDKMDESQLYLTATEHRECYDGLINRKDKDIDEDPSVGSDRGLKKRKNNKDAEPTKTVHAEEPEFEVADSDMPQDQDEIWGEAKTTSYERLQGRPTAATKNHMILSYDVLIIQNSSWLNNTSQQIMLRDLLVPLNKQYDVAKASKKINLLKPSCPTSERPLET